MNPASTAAPAKSGLVRILVPIGAIRPSPENDTLYKPIDPHDPAIQTLAASIRKQGILQDLVLTLDNYILSGHRRYAAATLAGLAKVPCHYADIYHADPEFVPLLRQHNLQREKTDAERLREIVVSANSEEPYQSLLEFREKAAQVDLPPIHIDGEKTRAVISKAKIPFLKAVIRVMNASREYWPLSLRQIHYKLLNNPPRIHAEKPGSVYENKLQCYKALSDLLTRARLDGTIPMEYIQDETRSTVTWDVHQTTTPFLERQINGFLTGYQRDLQQSQINHIEVCLEKNTVKNVLEKVAGQYSVPVTTMRGYTSIPPRQAIAERFRKSGKQKLILLIMSDLDPDGEVIAHSLARSLRDDFGIENIHPVKVGLTFEQVKQHGLHSSIEAKTGSSNYAKFTKKYGNINAYELEAADEKLLETWLQDAIDGVLDVDAYNAEVERQQEDEEALDDIRAHIHRAFKSPSFGV